MFQSLSFTRKAGRVSMNNSHGAKNVPEGQTDDEDGRRKRGRNASRSSVRYTG